ncbi:recombinase family protein [Poseidonibacter lekithochrous]|uniref:recombinase family protein n=1 Tax=Poseidonibacter TaxID=2321187 RepID=UPI001C0855A5|nr:MULTISPECIES: recombinase family protein [Poseidonibacter]MBU3013779.1 recombinase family protein [Poseidonibacter lekithochrous]MDO6827076.1 recombinase family protein [Poseidonibacter sp. 1_MG-2023]
MNKIIGYCRVSTDVQTTENQRREILDYVHSKNLTIDEIIEVTISSRKNTKDREIDKTLLKLERGDTLIVTKLDRLGRSTIEVLKIIEELKEKGIILQIIKDSIVVDDNNTNPINTMMLTLLSGFAQMERDFISERTKSALAQRKAQGVKLGRKKGQIVKSKFDEHKEKIEELLSYGVPISKIVNQIGIGTRQSLTTYINTRGLKK